MESSDPNNEVKMWLMSMIGKMIDVMILQKPGGEMLEKVVWKGRGKVLRCVPEGVVLDLNAGGASWWSRFWGNWGVKHVVSRWIQQPLSVPYGDLRIDLDAITRTKWLVIDAATWKRSPEELAEGSVPKGDLTSPRGKNEG
jgi:hypothetical protein